MRTNRVEFEGGWALLQEPTLEEIDAFRRTRDAGYKVAAVLWLYDRIRVEGEGEPPETDQVGRFQFCMQMLNAHFDAINGRKREQP